MGIDYSRVQSVSVHVVLDHLPAGALFRSQLTRCVRMCVGRCWAGRAAQPLS